MNFMVTLTYLLCVLLIGYKLLVLTHKTIPFNKTITHKTFHKIISSSNIKNYHNNSIEYTLRVSQSSK